MAGALSPSTPRNSFVGRCEGWGLLAQPGHPAQGATSDFPPILCGPENSDLLGVGGCLLSRALPAQLWGAVSYDGDGVP